MPEKPIYIFDICGTLYKSNTTFDFLSWIFKKNRKFNLYKKVYSNILWKAFNKFLRHFFRFDLTRILALYFLRGFNRDVLSQKADEFVNSFLVTKKNNDVINTLNKLKENRSNIIIMSATIDIVAKAIAKSLQVEHFCSSALKYDGSICCGYLDRDLLGNKSSFLKDNVNIAAVFTDDLSDTDILELAKEKNIIIYKKTSLKWSKLIKKKKWNVNLILC